MPTYEFSCSGCEQSFDLLLSFKEYEEYKNKNNKCPNCGLESFHKQIFSAAPIRFSGAGWTPKFHRDSTGSLKDNSVQMIDELKNTKSSDVYNTTMPKNNK